MTAGEPSSARRGRALLVWGPLAVVALALVIAAMFVTQRTATPVERPNAVTEAPAVGRSPVQPAGAPSSAPAAVETPADTRRATPTAEVERVARARIRWTASDDLGEPLAGERVVAQTWDAASGAIRLHEATIGPDGIAAFELDAPTHVDWFRLAPRPASRLPVTVLEAHADLVPGELLEDAMEVAPGGFVHGIVQHADGSPAAGIPVHAYFQSIGQRHDQSYLGEWCPAHASATTAVDGSFRLPELAGGRRLWHVAIPPSDWYQVRPDLLKESGWVNVGVGETHDLGVFRVAPIERLGVTVVDAEGEPVRDAFVRLVPRTFDSPCVLWADGGNVQGVAFAQWLADGQASTTTTEWTRRELVFRTGESGRAACLAVAGVWDVRVHGQHEKETDATVEEVRLPGPDRVVVLGRDAVDLSGVVVDREGEPVENAYVVVTDLPAVEGVRTDAAGRFAFEDLALGGGPVQLVVRHGAYLTRAVDVERVTEPLRCVLFEAAALRIRLTTPDGSVPPDAWFRLADGARPVRWFGEDADLEEWLGTEPEAERGRVWRPAMNEFWFVDLFPGAYRVAGGFGSVGERDRYAEWILETGPETHELALDPAQHAPAPLARLELSVRDGSSGEPIPYAFVGATDDEGYFAGFRTGRDGRTAARLAPGRWRVHVARAGFRVAYFDPFDYGEGVHPVDVALERGGDLTVRFLGAHGGRLPDLDVELRSERLERLVAGFESESGRAWQNWSAHGVAPGGRLTLRGLPPDPFVASLSANGHAIADVDLETGPGSQPRVIDVHLGESVDELRQRIRAAMTRAGDERD